LLVLAFRSLTESWPAAFYTLGVPKAPSAITVWAPNQVLLSASPPVTYSISFIFDFSVTTVGRLFGFTAAVFTKPSAHMNGHFLAGVAALLAPTCIDLKRSVSLDNHGFPPFSKR
jgi:hypothetical protein